MDGRFYGKEVVHLGLRSFLKLDWITAERKAGGFVEELERIFVSSDVLFGGPFDVRIERLIVWDISPCEHLWIRLFGW